ncbi:MAG: c-type cytochrome domain-containing protein [Singulisphaera sp.]
MKTLLAVLPAFLLLPGPLEAREGGVDYVRDVKPLLSRRCVACHGALKKNAGLRLDTAAHIRTGGDGGPAVVAGKGSESLLIEAVTGGEDWRMPPAGEGEPLSAEEIARLKAWIDAGARAPTRRSPTTPHALGLPDAGPARVRGRGRGMGPRPDRRVPRRRARGGPRPRPAPTRGRSSAGSTST